MSSWINDRFSKTTTVINHTVFISFKSEIQAFAIVYILNRFTYKTTRLCPILSLRLSEIRLYLSICRRQKLFIHRYLQQLV